MADELGTLNLLTPENVKNAVSEIETGETIPLKLVAKANTILWCGKLLICRIPSLPINAFIQPMNPVRKPASHTIIAKGHANDDEVCRQNT